jgi:hypothetical protein
MHQPFDTIINDNKKLIKQKEAVLISKTINLYKNKGSVFLNSDLLLLLELHGGGGSGLKVSVRKNIFFWVCRFGIVALFLRLFCFWVLLCCCVCVCFVFGFQSKVNCAVLFVLCWFVEQLNCPVLFWFPEQVNCVLCESRERDREEVKVAFSVESAPTLFFFSVFGGGGVD